ncbi:hypothetical protein AB1Y20_003581 [Prymnesium parvum]|uniref:Uncharacterized protein n=1 Tax=Prymnesium parvum TaxID=97485 RepID=A0AB34J581_PRYPA
MAAAPSACSSSRRYTSRGSPTKQTAESIDKLIANAEMNLISTTPGAVPPHVDDGGHLPFGGMIGGTRGPSAFGKRKLTTANALGNPQALLLNYPPEPTPANLRCWERNYKSSLYLDPSIEGERLITTNHLAYGFPKEPSYLADQNRTWGNLRQTSFTRPTPSPKYFPPPRSNTPASVEATTYTWKWPAREVRPPAPTLKRPEKVSYSFLEEYELRPPWLKY